MKKLYFIFISFLLSHVMVLKLNAQQLDTVYFQSSFGICIRKIDIIDKANNNKSQLNKFEAKWRAAVPLVVNSNTDTIMIVVKKRYSFKKIKTHIRLVDIEKKYVYLFVYRNRVLFEYYDRKLPGVF